MAFRTKKISQMDPKGSNLASTDLLEISQLVSGSYVTKSITGAEIISGATTGFVPTSRTLTINGTTQDLSANRTFTVSTGITIGTTAITSGTVGRVLFEGTGNVVQESANLFWDNTNGRLGIGTSSPASKLDIRRTNAIIQLDEFSVNSASAALFFTTKTSTTFAIAGDGTNTYLNSPTNYINFSVANVEKMRMFANGNFAINTTTDAGYKLDVNGTARVSNTLTVSHPTFTGLITISATANQTHRITGPGGGTITFGPDNAIRIGIGETYFSGDVLANSFWMQSNGSTVFGAQSTPPASTLVEMRSTTKGFLPPRMTTTQKNAIATPATGLMVYDTTLNLISVYNGTTWISL